MSNSTELALLQGYSEQGEQTRPITRAEAVSGHLHGSSHVWIWRKNANDEIEVLLQRRAHNKASWPDYFDISAAGHLDAGETTLAAAIRETKEEIGIEPSSADLFLFDVHRAHLETSFEGSPFIENEFQWLYLLGVTRQTEFTFADGEVSSICWVSTNELRQIIDHKSDKKIVPHGSVYFDTLFDAIARQK